MKKAIKLFVLITILIGCNQEKKINQNTINLDDAEKSLILETDKRISIKNFDSLFQKKSIIKLETNPASITSGADKIVSQNNIYVFDWKIEYSITSFDKNGKFKFKLKKIGRGPHEYFNYIYGDINDYTGDIELIANSGKRLMIYDSIGNFKKSMKLPYSTKSFCSVIGRRYFYKGYIENNKEESNFRVYSLDYEGKNIKKYLPYKVSKDPNSGSRYLYGFSKVKKGEYRFYEKYNDVVYKINSNLFTPLYKITFKGYEKNKPQDFLYNAKKYGDQTKWAKKLKIPSIYRFNEYKNYIIGMCDLNIGSSGGALSYFIYDKKNKKILHNSFGMFFSDKIKINTARILPKTLINNMPASYIYPTDIDMYVNSPTLEIMYNNGKELKEILTSYFDYDGDINTNPYLITYETIKEK